MRPAAGSTVRAGGLTVLRLDGDLTAAATPTVQAHLERLLRQARPHLVIDLSGVASCDSSVAALLNRSGRRAARRGGEIRLAAPPAGVCGLLRDTGLMRAVRTYGSLDGAIAGNVTDLLATPDRMPAPLD